jgi:toxin ParE1/3/4
LTLPIVLQTPAEADFDEAADWYERQETGLGLTFIRRVHDTLESIASRPSFFPIVLEDIHRAKVRRFPYLIFYRLETQQIVVLAIVHGRRHPRVWQQRI